MKKDRIIIRASEADKALIKDAAVGECTTLSAFVLRAARIAAKTTIDSREHYEARDRERLASVCKREGKTVEQLNELTDDQILAIPEMGLSLIHI